MDCYHMVTVDDVMKGLAACRRNGLTVMRIAKCKKNRRAVAGLPRFAPVGHGLTFPVQSSRSAVDTPSVAGSAAVSVSATS